MIVYGKVRNVGCDAYGSSYVCVAIDNRVADTIKNKQIKDIELRMDDGRHITVEQRKKIYATINDIAFYLGYLPEELKEEMKYYFVVKTKREDCIKGESIFSLSDCSVDLARDFINFILTFAIENDVPLSDFAINRTDDIDYYLYICLKHKRCCICGKPGEIHHVDTIGMGNNRKLVDDSSYRKMCLCRMHHTVAHTRGIEDFEKMYKVYGVIYTE